MARYSQDWTDFAVGTTESGLTGFTERGIADYQNFLIEADTDAPAGKSLRITRGASSDNAYLSWDVITSDPARADCDVLALIRINAWNSSSAAYTLGGLVARASGTHYSELRGCYGLIGSDNGGEGGSNLRYRTLVKNAGSLAKSARTGIAVMGQRYWLRLRLSGTRYRLSLHAYADPDGTPIDEMTGTAGASNGTDRVALTTYGSAADLSVLYLAVGTGADAAPLPAGPAELEPVKWVTGIPDIAAISGSPLSASLVAHFEGSQRPFAYALHAGTLPAGVTLDATAGILSGVPATAGEYPGIIVRVTDADGHHADSNAFGIAVAAAPQVVIDGDFERSCVDAALSSYAPDSGDGAPIIRIRVRRQTCDSSFSNAWLEPMARLTGVQGLRPWVAFEPYTKTGGDNANAQPWLGTQRAHYSYDGRAWQPFMAPQISASELRFRAGEAFAQDVVYVARSWPRTVTQVGEQIEALAAAQPTRVHRTVSALTPALTTSFPAQYFIVGEVTAKTDEQGKAVPPVPLYGFELRDDSYTGQRTAMISGGVHAGEDLSEIVLWQLVEAFVHGTSADAQQLRKNWRILVYPLVSPHGRYAGYWRGSPGSDVDPNRDFIGTSSTHEHVAMLRDAIAADAQGAHIWLSLDIHATRLGSTAQLGVRNSHPATLAFNSAVRARHPSSQWSYYDDPATANLVGGSTLRSYMAREYAAEAPMLFEVCDRTHPLSPTVLQPFADALLGGWMDIDNAGHLSPQAPASRRRNRLALLVA